jgi:flagellar protein FlbD
MAILADTSDVSKRSSVMIELTRLNGNPILLNSDLIKMAEASPDTMLTLINGEKVIVREELKDVLERVLTYRARLLEKVARRLAPGDEVRRAASLMSLEFPGETDGNGNPSSDL